MIINRDKIKTCGENMTRFKTVLLLFIVTENKKIKTY